MITCIQDIDNLSSEELESLQEILNVLSPSGNWNGEALDNAVEVQSRIISAERKVKVEEGILRYIELLKGDIKEISVTDNELIYLCLKKCYTAGLYIEDELP